MDLGTEKVLDKIVVWSRTDGGDAWLKGYKVLALDASRNVIWQVSPPEYPKPSSEFAPSVIPGGFQRPAASSCPAALSIPPPTGGPLASF